MSTKDIKFLRVSYLRGPNIWTYRPVIEAWLDIGEFEQFPSSRLPGFVDRLVAWLPGLAEHRCGVGEPGGFLSRLREGTWIGHVLEHVVLELQGRAGMRTGFGKTRQIGEDTGLYKMAFRTRQEEVGRTALEAGRRLVLAAVEDQPFDVPVLLAQLTEMVDDLCLGPSTACIVDAATERRIPSIRLTDGNLVQLGHGARQRRIWTAETDRTSAIAEGISGDKHLTKSLLAAIGVPVPEGRVVSGPEDAVEAADEIGAPVAVKPVDGNHGRGVSLNLSDPADIRSAYALADQEGSEVIVERFVPGNEHRLLVVGNRVVAAARGETAWVTADGRATLDQLIDAQLNNDPRRGVGEEFPLNRIRPSQDTVLLLELQRQGFTPDSVPAAGQRVLIQRNGNVANDCTDLVHPEVAESVTLAVRAVGLDIAGVDLVAEDIARPLGEQGAAIVEINAGPGLLTHLRPATGEARPVGQAIVQHLFPEQADGRIPIIGVVGRSCSSEIARMVAWLLRMAGHHVGLACSDGVFLDRRQVRVEDAIEFDAGQRLLMNRSVTAAVFESRPEAILAEGLPYDRCAVGVVTGLGEVAPLAGFHIHGEDQLYDVMRTQVDVVLEGGAGVLNAADPRTVEMAALCEGEVILYGPDSSLPAIQAHRAEGGKAVYLRDGRMILATGGEELVLEELGTLPAHRCGCLGNESICASVAVGWVLGLAPDLIGAGIETFEAEQTALAGAPVAKPREH